MHATSIMANLHVDDIDSARAFYAGFLGLRIEEFNLGWVARYASPETPAALQLVTKDATSTIESSISVHTDDIKSAWAEAQASGYEIVHPLTTEAWGVTRFFIRAPDGNVINIVNHRD